MRKVQGIRNTLIFLFIIIYDQVTKYAAVASLNWQANAGISFGLFPNIPLWVFFISIILVFSFKTLYKDPKYEFALSLFMAGMFGNLIDRVRLGYVVDWIEIPFPFMDKLFLNIADMSLILGFICFIYYDFKNLSAEQEI